MPSCPCSFGAERAARIASRVKGQLNVVHVIAGDASGQGDSRAIETLKGLTADLGARWHEMQDHDPARALIDFARDHQVKQIVIGSSQRSRWQEFTGGGSIVRRVIREAGAVGIDVHVIVRRELTPEESDPAPAIEDS
jgi:two-component system sensor histidine kinase KdpD